MAQPCLSDDDCTLRTRSRCDRATGQCTQCRAGTNDCGENSVCSNVLEGWVCVGCDCDPARDCFTLGIATSMPMCCGCACVAGDVDRYNCGACRHVCADPTPACVSGRCVAQPADMSVREADMRSRCPKGTDCGGMCADLTADPAHCGVCNNVCPLGVDCVGGKCVGCHVGLIDCNGHCVDPNTDPFNCGGCGNICGMPLRPCVNGRCQ